MKTSFKVAAAFACTAICAFSMTACYDGKPVNPTDEPPKATLPEQKDEGINDSGNKEYQNKPSFEITLPVRDKEGYKGFVNSVEDFAASFAEYAYAEYNKEGNFTVSPVSVYMALSLAAECAGGQTREEILSALGVSYEDLTEYFSELYASLEVEYKGNKYNHETEETEKISTGLLDLTNSIWVNEGTQVKNNCIDNLSEYFNSDSYTADFKNDNVSANKAIRDFVKESTRGLIDKDFQFSEDTLFTLINTLYLKTVWNSYGIDLEFTDKSYNFINKDGSVTATKLLTGYYNHGRVCESETFSTFYATTDNGYKLKFIVPKDGYGVDDVFTAENLVKINSVKNYKAIDDEAQKEYFTRCVFPEFKAKYDEEISGILKNKFGINTFFEKGNCNFTNLTDESVACGQVNHITDLTVDKTGIEGAAVTVDLVCGSAGPLYERVYQDFVIDKAFGFIITDRYDVTLFSGVVEKI